MYYSSVLRVRITLTYTLAITCVSHDRIRKHTHTSFRLRQLVRQRILPSVPLDSRHGDTTHTHTQTHSTLKHKHAQCLPYLKCSIFLERSFIANIGLENTAIQDSDASYQTQAHFQHPPRWRPSANEFLKEEAPRRKDLFPECNSFQCSMKCNAHRTQLQIFLVFVEEPSPVS